ncbi:hypothetical protein GCM10027277_06430 [Pseudoduganella ginsengisoli]|uniref:DUF4142 domain-containing protein n=1 Tax=Pseudoduganella ginsengisoli TaxID=1462440 RepID=A0A6L6Q6R9_9BURK|nr:hypothetical protein [Pseudoduganella ginsengisoli]MTW05295.1 hypothetical protein [Pseudoduganella ginsengisoli]
MHKHLASILAVAALALPAAAYSQAQLSNNSNNKYENAEEGGNSAAAYLKQYAGVAQETSIAQAKLLAVLGMTEQAGTVAVVGRELAPSSPRTALEDVLKSQAETAQLLTRGFASAKPLAAESRDRLSADVAAFALTVAGNAALAKDMAANRRKLAAFEGLGVTQAVYLAKVLPEHVKALRQALKDAASYAAANGITLPPEVAAAAG